MLALYKLEYYLLLLFSLETIPAYGAPKIGELWSTNKKVIDVNVNQPKWTFSRDYILALKGC